MYEDWVLDKNKFRSMNHQCTIPYEKFKYIIKQFSSKTGEKVDFVTCTFLMTLFINDTDPYGNEIAQTNFDWLYARYKESEKEIYTYITPLCGTILFIRKDIADKAGLIDILAKDYCFDIDKCKQLYEDTKLIAQDYYDEFGLDIRDWVEG